MAVEFEQDACRPQLAVEALPFHEWILTDRTHWSQFFRIPSGYLVRFPGLADFQVSPDGLHVQCSPVDGTSAGSIQHLFLNQVLPLALSRAGNLVFHASAVAIDGSCVAFMGESGKGKSTLAASFASCGYSFLTDDGLVVESRQGRPMVLPSHPSVRLWEDSRKAVVPAAIAHGLPVQYTSKARFLANDLLAFCAEPRMLRRVYFLGDGSVVSAAFERLTPGDALIELVKHSFLLDIDLEEVLAAHFHELAALVDLPIFYRLDYPRQFDALGSVRAAVIEHAAVPPAGLPI